MSADLLGRAAIALGAILVYRIGIHVPAPGVDPSSWVEFLGQGLTDWMVIP
jgi:preprotein translocase subunit SecY